METKTILLLLGAPGAGKGTQAKRLAVSESLPHVSTGDLFRENLKQGTPLGERARGFMESGQLVPDALVIEMLFDRVSRPDCAAGYLLDGFPRTLPQAEALDQALANEEGPQPHFIAIDLVVDDALIVRRASGRLICAACGHIQHTEFDPPRIAGNCDSCGGELATRKDDLPEVVKDRLAVYHNQTAPLVGHYESRGVLIQIDGEGAPDEVFKALSAALHDRRGGAA